MHHSGDQPIISFVIPDPEPQVSIVPLDSKRSVFECYSGGPNLLAAPFAYLLELQ